MEFEDSSPHSQVPATCPYPEPEQSSPCLPFPLHEGRFQYYPSRLRLSLPTGLFPSGFPTKTLYEPLLSAPIPPPYVPHTPPISFFLMWSPEITEEYLK
jgi:hypothetical protein